MKKILVLILVLISLTGLSQVGYPGKQTIGADSTLVNSPGALRSRLINLPFNDTTQANTQRIRQYPGAQIFTSTDNSFWFRSRDTTIWIKSADSSSAVFVVSYSKNATLDSTILLLSDGTRYAAKDSTGSFISNPPNPYDPITDTALGVPEFVIGPDFSDSGRLKRWYFRQPIYIDTAYATTDTTLHFKRGTIEWDVLFTHVTDTTGWKLTGNTINAATHFIGTNNNASLRFHTNGTEKMVLDSNGRLGTGVLKPLARLHQVEENTAVPRGIRLEQNTSDRNAIPFEFYKSRGSYLSQLSVHDSDYIGGIGFFPYSGTSSLYTVGLGSRVSGIPTTTTIPTDFYIATDSAGILGGLPWENNKIRFLVKSDGRIGIPTLPTGGPSDSIVIVSGGYLGKVLRSSVGGGGTGTVTNVTSTAPLSVTGTSTITPNIVADTSKSIGRLATFSDIALKQNLVTLTTTGTSGAATFNQGTGALNIPTYAAGTGTVTNVTASAPLSITGTSTITPNVVADTSTPVTGLVTKYQLGTKVDTSTVVKYSFSSLRDRDLLWYDSVNTRWNNFRVSFLPPLLWNYSTGTASADTTTAITGLATKAYVLNNAGGGGGTLTGSGVFGRIAYWNGASSLTSDTSFRYNKAPSSFTSNLLKSFVVTPAIPAYTSTSDTSIALDVNPVYATPVNAGNRIAIRAIGTWTNSNIYTNGSAYPGGAGINIVESTAGTDQSKSVAHFQTVSTSTNGMVIQMVAATNRNPLTIYKGATNLYDFNNAGKLSATEFAASTILSVGSGSGYLTYSAGMLFNVSGVTPAAKIVQTTGDLLVGTVTDDPTALLNVTSTTKGSLPAPRVTTTQRNLIGTALSAGSITSGGSGYTNGGYAAAALTGGSGSGGQATITVAGGAVTVVTLSAVGSGYNVGDVLTSSAMGGGTGFTWTVSTLNGPPGLEVYNTTTKSKDILNGNKWNSQASWGYTAVTTTYAATTFDYTIDCTGGGTFTVTLPTAVGIAGRKYIITNSGAGTITVGTTSSQTYTNVTATPTSITIVGLGAATVQSTGAAWLRL